MAATTATKALGKARERRRLALGLARLTLIATLIAGLIPLVLLSVSTLREYQTASEQASAAATAALDDRSIAFLQNWSGQVSDGITEFLDQRVRDTRAVAIMPRTADAYQAFDRNARGEIWYQAGTTQAPRQVREMIPMYREIAYVGADGWEKIRIADGQVVPPGQLRYVADPGNTTYKTETYFADAKPLPEDQVYVSHMTAWHTAVPAQPAGQLPADAAPGADYGAFVGVIRFATPVFTGAGQFDGEIVLSLDYRLVMERVIHILPTAAQKDVVWPDFNSGDYATLWDDQGYLIAQPVLSELRGLDANGQLVAPLMPSTPVNERKLHPFNMAVSADPASATTYQNSMLGQSFFFTHTGTSGIRRADFVTPIAMPSGAKGSSAYFGAVSIGANTAEFHQAATRVQDVIQAESRRLQIELLVISALGVAILALTATLIARWVTRPVLRLTDAARTMEEGDLDTHTLDALLNRRIVDEVTTLSQVFKRMAEQVQLREKKLKQEIVELHIQIDEQKKQQEITDIVGSDFFKDLQANADAIRSKYRRSH